jgi:hypothetical protein
MIFRIAEGGNEGFKERRLGLLCQYACGEMFWRG